MIRCNSEQPEHSLGSRWWERPGRSLERWAGPDSKRPCKHAKKCGYYSKNKGEKWKDYRQDNGIIRYFSRLSKVWWIDGQGTREKEFYRPAPSLRPWPSLSTTLSISFLTHMTKIISLAQSTSLTGARIRGTWTGSGNYNVQLELLPVLCGKKNGAEMVINLSQGSLRGPLTHFPKTREETEAEAGPEPALRSVRLPQILKWRPRFLPTPPVVWLMIIVP